MEEVPESGTLREALEELRGPSDAELRRARAHAHVALFGELDDGEGAGQPLTVGRYRLLANVGAGGLGHVWAAHDPHLDRVVAVKILRDDTLRHYPPARAQLLAEAAIMARLTHPNVVRVYDLGEADGELFVAMEYVEGQTLRTWQEAAARRGWSELIAVYLEAGEGLAAAHQAGLVHGDFKPDNVLIGKDGRVLVSDFAVTSHLIQARAEAEAASASPTPASPTPASVPTLAPEQPPSDSPQIPARSAALLGTPAYMAPEQLDGQAPDPRSDQFAYCVALWEALTGERPFPGTTATQLRAAIQAGPRELDPERRVPTRLGSILRRGLSVRPEQRYASIAQLLADLQRHVGRRRRIAVGLGMSALVLASVAGVVYGLSVRPPLITAEVCPIEPAELTLAWPAERPEVAARLADSTLDVPTSGRVLAGLDAFVDSWERARQRTCVLLEFEGDAGLSSFHERARCMHAAASAFSTSVEILEAPEAELVLIAQPMIAELPEPLRCTTTTGDPHPRERPPSLEVRRRLARARALQKGQRYTEAAAIIDELRAEAEAEGSAETLALIELERGIILQRTDDPREALRVLERASALAEASDDLRTEMLAATHCASVHMELDERPSEIAAWAERAIYLSERLDDPGQLLSAKLLFGYAALRAGDGEQALAIQTAALHEAEATLGADDPALAYAHDFLGGAHGELGHVDEARAHKRRAIELLERHYGPEHLDLTTLLRTSAMIMLMLGERDEGRLLLERDLALLVKLLGPEHPRTRGHARVLGWFWLQEGRPERAEPLLAGDHTPFVALVRAEAALDAGQPEHAAALLERARPELESSRSPRLRVQLLELDGRLALALDDFAGVRAAAETIAVLADLLVQPRFELPAAYLSLAVAHAEGRVDPDARARLVGLIDNSIGVSADIRARASVLLWRTAPEPEREAAAARARQALARAFGPTHPLRRALDESQQ